LIICFLFYFLEIYWAKRTEELKETSEEVKEIIKKDSEIKFKPFVWN